MQAIDTQYTSSVSPFYIQYENNASPGFSSRLSSHEGPKACAFEPSLRKDRDSCSASLRKRSAISCSVSLRKRSAISCSVSLRKRSAISCSASLRKRSAISCSASLRKRSAITNPLGFSSRLYSHEGPKACAFEPSLRKDRDSNPGCPQGHNGFRDRPDRPLRHLSVNLTRSYVSFCGCKGTKCF